MKVLLAVLVVWIAACSDSNAPARVSTPVDSLPGLIVSAPIPPLAASMAAPAFGAALDGNAVYVSLAPGSVPNGRQATIRNLARGLSVTTAVLDGGFDPVGLVANTGDSLLVTITRSGSASPVLGILLVKATRPLIVVRTDPPPRKVDVPLNATIVIVFSAPIDATTLTTGSIQLFRDTTPVLGTVRFADVAHLRAEFHPDTLLTGQTDYHLVLSQGIHDVNGEALDSAVTVPFTTGSIPPPTGLVFVSVSASYLHTCAVTDAGAAFCWGANGGALGNGETLGARFSPVPVVGSVSFAALSAGYYHTCGLTAPGDVYCWGQNGEGELGNGDTTTWVSPGLVMGGLRFAALSAGDFHTCGFTAAGAAYCWGANSFGRLGDGTNVNHASPVLVAGGLSFTAISAGLYHTCGLTAAGAGYCWGYNGDRRLGDWTQTDRWSPGSPVVVLGEPDVRFTALSAGAYHTCGLSTAGDAYCWGEYGSGQLGIGFGTGGPVAGGLSFVAVHAGGQHSCGLTAAGDAYCWGANSHGQLGDGTRDMQFSPVLVAGGLRFAALSTGFDHTCGVTTTYAVYCWGANFTGQLGDGTTTDSSAPVKVAGQPLDPPPSAIARSTSVQHR